MSLQLSWIQRPPPKRQFVRNLTETDDGLVIQGVPSLHGGTVQGYNDHRIVMALSIAALNASAPVVITDRESICKSYPSFFEEYKRLGGNTKNL